VLTEPLAQASARRTATRLPASDRAHLGHSRYRVKAQATRGTDQTPANLLGRKLEGPDSGTRIRPTARARPRRPWRKPASRSGLATGGASRRGSRRPGVGPSVDALVAESRAARAPTQTNLRAYARDSSRSVDVQPTRSAQPDHAPDACSPLKAEAGRRRRETPAADSSSALIPSGAPVGPCSIQRIPKRARSRHRLLEVGPVAIPLTRDMLARCLIAASDRSSMSSWSAPNESRWPALPSDGTGIRSPKRTESHEVSRCRLPSQLSLLTWRRSGPREPTTDRDQPRMRAPRRSPRRSRTGVRVAPPTRPAGHARSCSPHGNFGHRLRPGPRKCRKLCRIAHLSDQPGLTEPNRDLLDGGRRTSQFSDWPNDQSGQRTRIRPIEWVAGGCCVSAGKTA
jgi:hypothetical protein